MDELLNEHEQGERVRSWLQRNAAGLIGGIALGLALIFGWNWWQARQGSERQAEAAQYDRFEQALAVDPALAAGRKPVDPKQAVALNAKLAGTPYAAVAALELAKAQVDAGQETAALATLKAAKSSDPQLAAVLRERTAELLIATGKPAEAVQLLGNANDAAALEVLGDAKASLGKSVEAQQAYRQALRTLEEGSPERQVVELKLADVGGQAAS